RSRCSAIPQGVPLPPIGASGAAPMPEPNGPPVPLPPIGACDSTSASNGDKPAKGVLAGEVKDVNGRRVGEAAVVVFKDVQAGDAPLIATTDRGGFFCVSGLEAGKSYALVASKRDGKRILSGDFETRCPNPAVLICLKREEPAVDEKPAPTYANSRTFRL